MKNKPSSTGTPHQQSSTIDMKKSLLSSHQVERLRSVLNDTWTVDGRGSFPTLHVQLRSLVSEVRKRLKERHRLNLTATKLNGGAASHILARNPNLPFSDVDLIYHVDLSDDEAFEEVKEVVLDSLTAFLPHSHYHHQTHRHTHNHTPHKIRSGPLKDAYIHKMVKVTDMDRWSLFSLNNDYGKCIELKFVHRMRRQYEFSVDSFQITLDPLLDLNDHDEFGYWSSSSSSGISTGTGGWESPLPPPLMTNMAVGGGVSSTSISEEESDLGRWGNASTTLVSPPPPPGIVGEETVRTTMTVMGLEDDDDDDDGINTGDDINDEDGKEAVGGGTDDGGRAGGCCSSRNVDQDHPIQSRPQTNVDGRARRRRGGRPDRASACWSSPSPTPPTAVETRTTSTRSRRASGKTITHKKQANSHQNTPTTTTATVPIIITTPGSEDSEGNGAGIGSSSRITTSAALTTARASESNTNAAKNTTTPSPPPALILVPVESVYGNFENALRHLNHMLIDTKRPEEIRGGGLLKYCHLLVRGYRAAKPYKCKQMERYMCSRFFIDFPDVGCQELKLCSYLDGHFSDGEQIKYEYLLLLYRVVSESTVCLMSHERKETLDMIDRLAYHLSLNIYYYQQQQHHQHSCQNGFCSHTPKQTLLYLPRNASYWIPVI